MNPIFAGVALKEQHLVQIGDVFRVAFAAAIEQLIRTDALLRVASDDPETVHQARIAVRQGRSLLRTFRPILDVRWSLDLEERLRGLGDGLGTARNADALLANLRHCAQRLPAIDASQLERVLAVIERERAEAHVALGERLRAPQYAPLLAAIVEAAEQPVFNERASAPVIDAIPELMGAIWRNLRKAVRGLSSPPTDAELHRIRIKAKRARYAAQAVTPFVGHAAETFAQCLESLQAVLGRQHDAVVGCARLRELGKSPELAFAAGELVAFETAEGLIERRKWHKAWHQAARRRNHFWTAM